MKYKTMFLSSIGIILSVLGAISIFFHCWLKEVSYDQPSSFFSSISYRTSSPKKILLINTEKTGFGGREIHTINLYKALKTIGHQPYLLISENSTLEKEIQKQQLSYFATKSPFVRGKVRHPSIYFHLLRLSSRLGLNILHCDGERDLVAAKACAFHMPVKICFTQHRDGTQPERALRKISGIDGLIGVNKNIEAWFQNANAEKKITCPHVSFIPPFFNHERFLSSSSLFKDPLGSLPEVKKSNDPVFASIARLDLDKNLSLLIDAWNILINEKSKKAHLLMIGNGPLLNTLKKRARAYNLENYIHFLGFCDNVPALLSTVWGAILSTKEESFGIALAEAGLMKTVPIGPTNTGVIHTIIDDQTGYLFQNNDEHSLANAIANLIEHPEKKELLGNAACQHVLSNLTPITTSKLLDNFYTRVCESSSTLITSST